MTGPDGTPAGLIAALHVLREEARVVQAAAVVPGALSAALGAAFAASCDHTARAVLDMVEQQHAVVIDGLDTDIPWRPVES